MRRQSVVSVFLFSTALVSVGVVPSVPAAAATTYTNPVIVRAGGVSSPFVVETVGGYAALASADGFNVAAWSSAGDLGSWTANPVEALPTPAAWVDSTVPIGAPAVLEAPSGYVLYYQAQDAASGSSCIGAATGTSAVGPFSGAARPALVCDPAGAFEPSITVDGLGTPVLIWRVGAGDVAAQTLTSDGLDFAAGSVRRVLQSGGAAAGRPALLFEGGRAHLFAGGGMAWCTVAAGEATGCETLTPWLLGGGTGTQPFVGGTPARLWLAYEADGTVAIDKLCVNERTPRTNAPSSGAQSLSRVADCLADVPLAKDPVGWTALRRLDLLPKLVHGVQAKQFSSFARNGSNSDGGQAGSTCRRMTADGCVVAEAEGPGEIDSIWATDLGGFQLGNVGPAGRLKITIDGRVVVDHSLQGVAEGALGAPFSYPLVASASQNSSAVYVKVPMPYRSSMQVVFTGTSHGGYYHVAYKRFADAMGVPSFDPADTASDVLANLAAASTGTHDPKPAYGSMQTAPSTIALAPGGTQTLASITGGGTITKVALDPAFNEGVRLRISFDGVQTIDAPLGEFFGTELADAPVRALLFSNNAADGKSYSWWPMPFATGATVSLYNASTTPLTGSAEVAWSSNATTIGPGALGHFRASSPKDKTVDGGPPWNLLLAQGTGKVVGVNHTMWGDYCTFNMPSVEYLEGDERLYTDESRTPQHHGSGTEDFYEGGWYFRTGTLGNDAYTAFTNPFNGSPAQVPGTVMCGETPTPTLNTSAYRSLVTDAVPFGESVEFNILRGEFFAPNDFGSTYGSTTFWYGVDQASSAVTDFVRIGDPDSEAAHSYSCSAGCPERPLLGGPVRTVRSLGVPLVLPPTAASVIGELSSGFESDDATQYSQFVESLASGTVTFTAAVDPANRGIVLRRMTDQLEAYQSAEVSIDGAVVGTWTEPLNNPNEKYRWLEHDYFVPEAFTAGKTSVTVGLRVLAPPSWRASEYTIRSLVY